MKIAFNFNIWVYIRFIQSYQILNNSVFCSSFIHFRTLKKHWPHFQRFTSQVSNISLHSRNARLNKQNTCIRNMQCQMISMHTCDIRIQGIPFHPWSTCYNSFCCFYFPLNQTSPISVIPIFFKIVCKKHLSNSNGPRFFIAC